MWLDGHRGDTAPLFSLPTNRAPSRGAPLKVSLSKTDAAVDLSKSKMTGSTAERSDTWATSDSVSNGDGVRVLGDKIIGPLQQAHLHNLDVVSRLDVRQSWEGVVLSIFEEDALFTARLHNITDPTSFDAEATFEIADVSNNDRDLLRIGGVFRWMIGYRRLSYGQMDRVSAIVFRRLPAWTEEDLKQAYAEGAALASAFSASE